MPVTASAGSRVTAGIVAQSPGVQALSGVGCDSAAVPGKHRGRSEAREASTICITFQLVALCSTGIGSRSGSLEASLRDEVS